jgi:hypothetical protein
MTRLYVILAVVGWAWFVVAGVVLAFKLLAARERRRRSAAQGFDVDAAQPSASAPGPAANPQRET